jgi:hypothetical protein
MGSRLQQPVSIASNIFATLPCPRHLARVFLCRALPCVKLAAARAPWRMTRDPLAVARDPLAAIRWPWRPCPCPLPAIRRHPMADPMADPLADPMADPAADGRSGVIRWPIRRPMADPAIRWPIRRDPLAAQARSAGRPGAIRCAQARSAARPGAIRWPRSAARDPRSACQGPLWQLRLNGP